MVSTSLGNQNWRLTCSAMASRLLQRRPTARCLRTRPGSPSAPARPRSGRLRKGGALPFSQPKMPIYSNNITLCLPTGVFAQMYFQSFDVFSGCLSTPCFVSKCVCSHACVLRIDMYCALQVKGRIGSKVIDMKGQQKIKGRNGCSHVRTRHALALRRPEAAPSSRTCMQETCKHGKRMRWGA